MSQNPFPQTHAGASRNAERDSGQRQSSQIGARPSDQRRQEPDQYSQELPEPLGDPAASLLSRIEDIIEGIVDRLQENRPLLIPLRSRRTGRESAVLFPTASNASARRFNLFERQSYVDQIIDDIAFTFGVNRDALNIVATSKGLVAGGPFGRESDDMYAGIPDAVSLASFELRGIQWVMIVEKEATFRSLVAARYFDHSAAGPGLLITAKGYPDLATRQFLHAIHSQYPFIPLHGLVDFDPDGVGILRTYKLGSRSLRHEGNVTAPGLLWLGVKSHDMFRQEFALKSPVRSPQAGLEGVTPQVPVRSQQPLDESTRHLRAAANVADIERPGSLAQLTDIDYKTNALTPTDRRKTSSLLRMVEETAPLEAEELALLRELQIMLMLNVKFEIQAISGDGNMTRWLDERLSSGML
ncbi:hypothetical protein PFICI_07702 [Pestalotiopsis fici W106-1]|uniref:DNA topoisomerase (ATP-hydrolyzing) n=1 Tax=Pestalotiopsis fici (strain W106-1 / CGMCC3.15140) TaxID=1229662 RepID=W3X216_PESFW|nr:uncharacterized protein PFICI_07702 [Pestalotiopsis fici W106-1]ETS80173.1 hypothetical protein PFICI_07702 [Pestalotiopsis fici W106-1]